ncbi:MAG: SMC family ATPase [Halobacteriota archaeon]
MILRSLKLENVRSYKTATIAFPQGISLFEGDIGSGKSTILMAIEFALFGLGSQKGGSLLKTNESKGSVSLAFAVDGDEYVVRRTLVRKGGNVQQAEGHLEGPNGVTGFSPAELKERILEILRFNEPRDPRSQSLIYRYAIFTPQEEMKAILALNPQERLKTLYKVLRIEDYKIARDNAQLVSTACNTRAAILEASALDVETKRAEVRSLGGDISHAEETIAHKRIEEDALQRELDALDEQLRKLRGQKEALAQAEGRIPQLERQIERAQGDIRVAQRELADATRELTTREGEIEGLRALKRPTEQDESELKASIDALGQSHAKCAKEAAFIDSALRNYERIRAEGVCPTCGREADAAQFTKKIAAEEARKDTLQQQIDDIEKGLTDASALLNALDAYSRSQDKLALLQAPAEMVRQKIARNGEKIRTVEQEIATLGSSLGKARDEVKRMKQIAVDLQNLEGKRRETADALSRIGKDLSSLEATVEQQKKLVASLEREVEAKERDVKKARFLTENRIWLADYFIKALEAIERQVMIAFQQEFNQFFQQWFELLVEDPTKSARIDEDFSIIVEQDGYEQNVNYLSGGEKTSVALAYRLALNMIVRKVATSMKSNLLILDEPTDGFSKEQLLKVQDILTELECPQVIIVSHERELESFADQIFRVSKEDGISTIAAV